jgi:hypothetical protein
MKLFGFEVIIRRMPAPMPPDHVPPGPDAAERFQRIRDAIPIGDDEFSRAKPVNSRSTTARTGEHRAPSEAAMLHGSSNFIP